MTIFFYPNSATVVKQPGMHGFTMSRVYGVRVVARLNGFPEHSARRHNFVIYVYTHLSANIMASASCAKQNLYNQ